MKVKLQKYEVQQLNVGLFYKVFLAAKRIDKQKEHFRWTRGAKKLKKYHQKYLGYLVSLVVAHERNRK